MHRLACNLGPSRPISADLGASRGVRLVLAGHWIPKDLVDNIEFDCELRRLEAASVFVYSGQDSARIPPYSTVFRGLHCVRTPRIHAVL